jgi:hypothetical protein
MINICVSFIQFSPYPSVDAISLLQKNASATILAIRRLVHSAFTSYTRVFTASTATRFIEAEQQGGSLPHLPSGAILGLEDYAMVVSMKAKGV